MLRNLQLICFEANNYCNLAEAHKSFCPAIQEFRKGTTPASNDDFISFLEQCILNGFNGMVGFHRYNELTLDIERCLLLNEMIHALGLKSIAWSNGTYGGCLSMFDEVYVTNYNGDTHNCTTEIKFNPDHRINIYDTEPISEKEYKPCYRPLNIEMAIDFYGDLCMCCADWKGETEIGNIKKDDYSDILNNWENIKKIAKKGCVLCRRCQNLKISPAVLDNNFIV